MYEDMIAVGDGVLCRVEFVCDLGKADLQPCRSMLVHAVNFNTLDKSTAQLATMPGAMNKYKKIKVLGRGGYGEGLVVCVCTTCWVEGCLGGGREVG